MTFKSIFSFSNTTAIQLHLAKHQAILNIILSISPDQIRPHIKDCVINHDKLLIYVSSAAWASQLRFFQKQIKDAINQQSKEKIATIRIRIINPAPYKVVQEDNKKIPSKESIDQLHNHATAIAEGKLKAALLRLSHTLQKHQS